VGLTAEVAGCVGKRFSARALPALAADFSVWLLVYIMTAAEGVPEGYHAADPRTVMALSLGLLVIYGGSIGIRSFVSRHPITLFETLQGVGAFVLATYGVLRSSHESAAPALGILFFLLAGVCYWGALFRFADESLRRNRRVSATWAAALLVAATFLLFPAGVQVVFLCLAAIAVTFAYTRTSKLSLGVHASVYLAAAAAMSPLPQYVADALAGKVPTFPDWRTWVVGLTAALCYPIGAAHEEEKAKRRLLWFIPAMLLSFFAVAVGVVGVARLAAGRVELGASSLSVIRTVANCALALVLGILSSRKKRVELGWAAYTAVAFGTVKLFVEDLRFGNAASLVISLLFYGLVLILLPRLTRRDGERLQGEERSQSQA